MDQVSVDRAEYERLKALESSFVPQIEPQMLDTGRFGQIFVTQTWVMKEKSISKLVNGGYCHTTGLPISSEKEITDVIPPGADRDSALYWFRHRHEEEEQPGQGIIVHPDLTLTFMDGTPVKSISEITQAIKPGPHQETLIRLYMQQEKDKPSEIPEWMQPGQEDQPGQKKAGESKTHTRRRQVKRTKAAQTKTMKSAPQPLSPPGGGISGGQADNVSEPAL